MKHGLDAQLEAVREQQKKLEEAKGMGKVAESSQNYDVFEEPSGAEPKSALEIAERLNDWYQDYDTYEYNYGSMHNRYGNVADDMKIISTHLLTVLTICAIT